MKTGGKILWKSPFRRWCAVVLVCIMILTLAAPLPALAYGAETSPEISSALPGEEAPGEESSEPEETPPEEETPPGEETLPKEEDPEETPPLEDDASQPGDVAPPEGDTDQPGDDAPPEGDTDQPGDDAPPEGDTNQPGDDAPPEGDTNQPGDAMPPEDTGDAAVPPEQAPEDQQPAGSLGCPHGGEENCAFCVTGWVWQEDGDLEGALVWNDGLGLWTLGIPGLDEATPLTWDLLLSLLPQSVEATTAAGETKSLPLVWSQDANLEDAMTPEGVTVTATLDPQAGDYALTAAAPKLAVLVAAGSGEGYADLKMKFLNKWYFIRKIEQDKDVENSWSETDVLDGTVITVAIADLPSKTPQEIEEWIKDTGLLPTRLGGWTSPDTTDPRLGTLEFAHNTKKKDPFYETTADGDKLYPSTYLWGSFPIDGWDFSYLLHNGPYSDGEIIPIRAYTSDKFAPGSSDTYRVFVNSNDPADYAAGKPDTRTNPDILTLHVKLVDINLDDYIVDRVANPQNVKVNLFDYWVSPLGKNPEKPQGDILDEGDVHFRGKNDGTADQGNTFMNFSSEKQWNLGVNANHLLIFGDGIIHAGLWNKGAGQSTAYGKAYAGMEGIVKSVLGEDGYPVINTENARKQMMGVTDPADPNYRNHQLIGDYVLAGDHIGPIYYENLDDGKSPYECENINNLSETVISNWGKDLDKDIESLNYLFDPLLIYDFKASFVDVKGLFQLDEKGNYFYNMRDNFAEFRLGSQPDPNAPDYDPNRFILYNNGATTRTDGEKSIGNFFPFNEGAEVFNTINDDGSLGSTVPCDHNSMNHHLGMTVEVDFRQPAGGMINTGVNGGDPMTFGFSGDDDVWVFIDNVLVLDLGGTHSEIYGTIDFSTGEVCIGRAFDSKGIPSNPKDPANLVTQTTLKAQYEKAGLGDTTQWHNNTFASNTSHTLKMFYLERGNYDSSIALNFNLQPLLYQRIVKVDQNGKPLEGIEFALQEAEEVPANTSGAIQCLYTDSGDRGKIFYVKKKSDTPLVELKTGADGSAVFMTEDGQYFNFADRGDQYYILKETKAPEGYRDLPEDIVLHYDPTTSMLSVANRWTTGAYACSVSHVTAATSLTYGKVEDQEVQPGTESVPEDEQEKGIVVAVPLMRRKADKSWFALYGSNLQSFQPVPVGREGTESQWQNAILRAAVRQAEKNDTAGWYLEWDDGDHRLTGTLFDLPGLANRYLLNDPVNGDLHMVYGIIDSATLAALGITGDTAAARYESLREYVRQAGEETAFQALLGGFRFLNLNQFNRDFRSLIYIPNERRELRVLKIDQDGQPLAGTEFSLFFGSETTPRAKGVTDDQGMLVFSPTGDNSTPGQAKAVWANASADARYYLQETKAPAGYDLNPTRVPVVVGYYSIYADAGTPGDGVSVMAGVGTLTQTMRQYATSSEVDITLQDITATMQIQDSGKFDLAGWRDAKLSGTSIPRTMNLHFKMNTTDSEDYGLHDEDGGKVYTPYFITDTGYARTRIKQNWAALIGDQYEGASPDANMENLYDTDLTNLFSMVNIIVVSDRTDEEITTGSLTIGKELIGTGLTEADYAQPFYFTVELRDANGTPLPGHYEYRFYGKDKTGEIASGEKLILRHDEAVTILGLPVGTQYTVTEAVEEGWYPNPPSGSHTGTILRDETVEALFTNSKQPDDSSTPPSSSSSSSGSNGGSDDDGGDGGGGNDSSDPDQGSSRRTAGGSPGTGDETDTGQWAFLSILFLVGIAGICLDRYRKREDAEAEASQEPPVQS